MLLEVFIVLLAISLILLGLGYAVQEASFSIIGLTFLFVLASGALVSDNLEIPNGINETTTYSYNATAVLQASQNTQLKTYTNPETTFYGIWLAVIAGAGFFIIWGNMKPRGGLDE